MKKLFLFVAVAAIAFSLNSCSSSSSGGGSSLSFKVDGVSKNFKTTAVESDGIVYVTGYIGSAADPTETFSFSMASGETGDLVMGNISYTNATDTYQPGGTGSSNVTLNNGSIAKGVFAGTVVPFNSANSNLTLTQGTFSVSY